MHRIILATRNKGKVKEIRSIFCDLPISFESLLEHPDLPEIVEDGKTLEENARKKAKTISQVTGIPTLADDTGLEVFHLGMAPGVISARYAGENVSYDDNNHKLLEDLNGVPQAQRGAQFRCVVAFFDNNIEKITEGICHGRIMQEPRGTGGFGYDPLFQPIGLHKTFAELSFSEKNTFSHRAQALEKMKSFLCEYLKIIN